MVGGNIGAVNLGACVLSTKILNYLANGGCDINSKSIILEIITRNISLDTRCEIAHMWKPKNPINAKSTLVQVMAYIF